MWDQRTLQILIEGNPTQAETLEWIRRALPLFDHRVEEAFVSGSKVPNGAVLVEVALGEGRFAALKGFPRPVDFEPPPAWAKGASAFAVGIAQVASLSGHQATVIDSRPGGTVWNVLVLGKTPQGAKAEGPQAAVLREGQWVEDAATETHAGELVGAAVGRTIWTFSDFIHWWQSSHRNELEVLLPPSLVVWKGRRVNDVSRDPRQETSCRLLLWFKRLIGRDAGVGKR